MQVKFNDLKTSQGIIVFGSIACTLIVIAVVVSFWSRAKDSVPKKQASSSVVQQKRDPRCDIEYTNIGEFSVNEKEITWDDLTSFKKLVFQNNTAIYPSDSQLSVERGDFIFSPKLNKIAYIQTDKSAEGNNVDYVYLYDLTNSQKEIIYQMQQVPMESRGEYIKKITALSFSNNLDRLAITTGESLLIYHLDTKQIETVFEDPRDPYSFGVFSYSPIPPWPVNTKIVMHVGYYEGLGEAIVDVATKHKEILDYHVYGAGQIVLGIYGNNMIVSKVLGEAGSLKGTEIYLVNVDTLDEKLIASFEGSVFTGKVVGDELYFIEITSKESDAYLCYQGEVISPRNSFLHSILKLNLIDRTYTKLLTTDSTPAKKGNYRNLSISEFYVNQSANQVLVKALWGDVPMTYLLDESESNVLTQVN